ncbi:MAG TPA: tRNA guanosine(34) transglycosylase Tgt [Candidatus Paceibacterota bacterium]|nr:tRNA guanosine(34) transglycosylase Tgt [Candidatus Paceibacterota bacterium]
MKFTLSKRLKTDLTRSISPDVSGRTGVITTDHGVIKTPAFVAVGTKATLKAITPEQAVEAGVQAVLANTYHLYLEPGADMVSAAGGFAKMMNWKGPTMTDSGGFQVFSLGAAYGKGISKILKSSSELSLAAGDVDEEVKAPLVSIDHDGVMFRSHIDGTAHYFTPEKSVDIQHALGADMFFAFDECTSPTETRVYQREALDRTHRWAKRCLTQHRNSIHATRQAIFGVIQGGRDRDLREESAKTIADMGFDGFGIGGSFAKEDMQTAVSWVNALLPEDQPRHLLGIGEPEDLFMGAEQGVDLFDCVAPTRIARNGGIHTSAGRINITNAVYRQDFGPLDNGCACYTCKNFTRAYVAHLFHSKEMLAATLATIHNLFFISDFMRKIRESMEDDTFYDFRDNFIKKYYSR